MNASSKRKRPNRSQSKKEEARKARKHSETQRHHLEVNGDVFDRWCSVGTEHGLTTDTQIASFLLDRYVRTTHHEFQPSASCVHCFVPLKLVCATCECRMHRLSVQENGIATVPVATDENREVHSSSESRVLPSVACSQTSAGTMKNGETSPAGSKKAVREYSMPCAMETLSDKELRGTADVTSMNTGQLDYVEIKREPGVADDCDVGADVGSSVDFQKFVLDLSDVQAVDAEAIQTTAEQVCTALSLPEGPENVSCDNGKIKTGKRNRKVKLKHWLCEDCGSTFNRADTFRFHKLTHADCRPYACHVCGAAFRSKSHLTNHAQIHTDDRPYVCETCACCFKQMASLCRHRRLHSGDRPYACQQCSATFTRRSHLQRHMQKHTTARPHLCDICESAFKDPLTLKKHKWTHLSSEKFVCKECGSGFTRRGNLSRHLKTHMGTKAHICTECDRGFNRADHLARHMQTAHTSTLLEKTCADSQTGHTA
ncbi:hypothetical protein BaRGS_00010092 [Batillaria attramentaria]|uniref:C2H2-type domain-containing protein n=1 Tax=Batillaria attramentaria TaxID=370345 RepID=A0ABD0LH48_9CAEN